MKLSELLKVITCIASVALGLLVLTRLAPAGQSARAAFPPSAEGLTYEGAVSVAALPELSGLALSHRRPGLLWALNDSGNAATLIALDPARKKRGEVQVEGVINHDWEDLASFELDGQSYLLIADTGDNFALRSEVSLILIPEPEPDADRVTPQRQIRFRYEDGARDCEAMAVDVPGRRVLLADKGSLPAGLYELPLEEARVARRIAAFPDLVPVPPPRVQTLGGSRAWGVPTGMDLSPDGRRLAVLTYQSVSLFERHAGQAWSQALTHSVLRQLTPRLPLFESLVLTADGRGALIATEGRPAQMYRWMLPAAAAAPVPVPISAIKQRESPSPASPR